LYTELRRTLRKRRVLRVSRATVVKDQFTCQTQ
jgi:hypothetical protein